MNEGDLFSLAVLSFLGVTLSSFDEEKTERKRTLLWSAGSRVLLGYTDYKSKQIVMNVLQ